MEKTNTLNQSLNTTATPVEANGIDNEDSINLTIGEDEENLLAEEVKKKTIIIDEPIKSQCLKLYATLETVQLIEIIILCIYLVETIFSLFSLQTESHDRHKGKFFNV